MGASGLIISKSLRRRIDRSQRNTLKLVDELDRWNDYISVSERFRQSSEKGEIMNRLRSLFLIPLVLSLGCSVAGATVALPDPAVDTPLASTKGEQVAVLAGGCFWGIEAVFDHVKGVIDAESGYGGGSAETAHYEIVSSGRTGHAESVRVKYDPSQITFGRILKIFFSVAHDPTQLNRQGPDHGTQYRSAIFTTSDEQKKVADAYIAQLNAARTFSAAIVSKIEPNREFYPAEEYHQDFLTRHPTYPYI